MDSNGPAPAVVDEHNVETVALEAHLGGAIRRLEDVAVDLPTGTHASRSSSITAGSNKESDRVSVLVEFRRTASIERVLHDNINVNRAMGPINTTAINTSVMASSDRLQAVAVRKGDGKDGFMGRLIAEQSIMEVVGR